MSEHRDQLVVQVVPYYPPHVGGMENVARVVAEWLATKGPVEVLTSTSGQGASPRVQHRGHLTVRRLSTREIANVPVMPTLLYHLLRLPRDAVVHLHIAQAFVPEMVWLAARLRRRPYIAHFHLDVEPSGRFGSVFVAYKRWVLGGVLRSASTVIVVSPDQTDFVRRTYGVATRRIRLIPNGVGQEFYRGPRPAPDHGGPFRMLFVGRLARQKNVPRLLRAVASARAPLELVLVGDGDDRPRLERLIGDLALTNVRLVGAQFGQPLVDWYGWADAFILTSDREGTGLVLLEAMAAGVPVIANDVAGIRDTIGDDGILATTAPADLAMAIDRLAADPLLWEDLSRRGSRRADRFPWTVLFDSLEELYEETISAVAD
ncbi:MAG: glycosyltransferase family 4 protein [Acidimicrobiales bacterium]